MFRCAVQLSRDLPPPPPPPPPPLLPSASLLPPLVRDCVDRLWNRRNVSRLELYRVSRLAPLSSSSAWRWPGPVATVGAAMAGSSLLLALLLTRSARAVGGTAATRGPGVAVVVVSVGAYVNRIGSRGVLASSPPLVGSAWSDLRFLKNLSEGISLVHTGWLSAER